MRAVLALLLAFSLTACATASRISAANDVHALLVSIRDNDRQAFEAHVDRASLQREIEGRLVDQAHKSRNDGLGVLGAILAPSLAQIAGDAVIQPKVFRQVAEYYGYKPSAPLPNAFAIAGALKTLPDGRVCATKSRNGPCLLMFTRTGGVWRLSGFEGDMSMLRIKL